MQNLDQIRAAAAAKLPPLNRSDVASIPALILTNGLLSAAAFCCEKGNVNRKGMKKAFDGITLHLKERGITTVETGNDLIDDLSSKDGFTLQRATTESLAFLSYLKRFALKLPKQ